jgi:tRNA(Ile)-lysidine synthetase-like protein
MGLRGCSTGKTARRFQSGRWTGQSNDFIVPTTCATAAHGRPARTERSRANVRPVTALPLPERFVRHVEEAGLLAGARTLLVAHSGGGDSTALLLLVSERARPRGVAIVSAHVAHGLRGAAGDEDARFCARLAASFSLPFAFRPVDVPSSRKKGESLEAAARRLRYAALLALSHDLEDAPVLTGHTRDDQAETVLLHLERRLGRARGGIRPRRGDGVVRPLLPFSRAELREFLAERGVSFREDETNENDAFARNRIRRNVLPQMERKDPGRTERLARAGTKLGQRLDALDARLDATLAARKISLNGPWPRRLFRELGGEEAGRLLVRAAGAGGRVPGKAQVKKILSRLGRGDATFGEEFAGGRIEADPRLVRLVGP